MVDAGTLLEIREVFVDLGVLLIKHGVITKDFANSGAVSRGGISEHVRHLKGFDVDDAVEHGH